MNLAEVDVAPPGPMSLNNPVKVMTLLQPIAAPAARVFQTLIDLPARMQWIDGVKRLEFRDEQPNHIGKVHRCVRDGGDPEVVTSQVKSGESSMELWETDVKRLGACRYLLNKRADGGTDAVIEFYLRRNPILRLAFKLLLERKMRAGFTNSLRNLARLCEAAA